MSVHAKHLATDREIPTKPQATNRERCNKHQQIEKKPLSVRAKHLASDRKKLSVSTRLS